MTFKHLKFEELSDLIDNVLVEEEREYCLSHISLCKECEKEYQSLMRCVSLLSSLDKENLALPDFSQSTIIIYKSREKKKLLLKVIPAIAASIIMVTGIGFMKSGSFSKSNFNLTGNNNPKMLIEYMGGWKIIQVKNSYIDTEFDKGMLADIKNLLQKNDVKHVIIANPATFEKPWEKNINDITFVGTRKLTTMNTSNLQYLGDEKILVRIYK